MTGHTRSWLQILVGNARSSRPHKLARRPRGRPAALVWTSQIALGLLIAATTFFMVMQSRNAAMVSAERELRNFSLILADQAERAFEAVDLVQSTLLELVQASRIETPEGFRERMSGLAVNKELNDHGGALPQLDVIGLVDADGKFINVSHNWPVPTISVADRAYFQVLKANPDLPMFVSDPFVNRLTHTMAVVVAHRVSSSDGRFLGISFAGVLMSYFEKLYQTVASQQAMSIALFHRDGMLLARYPQADQIPGQSPGQISGQSLASGGIVDHLMDEHAESGSLRLTNRIDGVDRLVAGHTLARYPLIVSVSAPVSAILAPWRKQATYLTGAATLLELVVAAGGMLMLRQFRDQSVLAEARAARAVAEAATRAAEAELTLSRERERASQEMHVQHVRFGAALENMSQAICMFDAAGDLVVANRRVSEMFGLPAIEPGDGLTLNAMRDLLLQRSSLPPADVETIYSSICRTLSHDMPVTQVDELSDGRSLSVNFAPMEDDGWLVTLEDITERRLAEAKIAHLAHHDALTGLPNRALFHQRLEEAVARSRRGEVFALHFLDLDRFKAVNDTMGHPAGDALLCSVTDRLLAQVRDRDTVARLGGDEFAIVQHGADLTEHVSALAARIIDVVSAPYDLDGNRVTIGTSIGIAVGPQDGQDPDLLLKNADLALYLAKADGRGRFRFFEPAMNALMQARRALEFDLHQALEDYEFEVFYQPLVNIRTRTVCGFEALLRWRHPDRGWVSPAEFIPIAEEIGLVVPLGKWVLRQACRDAATWPGKQKVAVNLSPVQFASPTLVEDVAAALAVSGLDPARLELEITETVMLEQTDGVLAMLRRFRDFGVGIALDDFGTGYSSMTYLRCFPFTKVKIARTFIRDLGADRVGTAIVAATIDLSTSLGLTTTAEGVETAEQLRRLAAMKCTEAQGYLFSEARPAGDVADMCRKLSLRREASDTGMATLMATAVS
jgi:diguanylate cyclase (GGDEF)-like protein